MTHEIRLTKRYPNSRTEDIIDVYMRGWNDALDAVQNGKFIINDDCKTEPQTEQLCDGCEYSKPYIEYKCTHSSCKYEDEPNSSEKPNNSTIEDCSDIGKEQTMLTNDRERRICAKYSAIDEQGYVHCNECPLNKGNHRIWDFRCKATCHYNRRTREWEFDVQTKGAENE